MQSVPPSADQISPGPLDAPSLFMEAHKNYTEGMYAQATQRYEKLIHRGIQSLSIVVSEMEKCIITLVTAISKWVCWAKQS
jgi:hypothetical protein